MDVFDTLIDIYENQLCIPLNDKCQECDSHYKQPLLPWVIGQNYFTKQGRIFIAGKPHRGTWDPLRKSGIIDGRTVGENLFFNENWAYWSYTREILNNLYGSPEESWKHIAFSNVVKCSSTDNTDKTSLKCATQCIKENKVIIKEIELLKPRKILFYSWNMYRGLFSVIPFAEEGTVVEHTDINHQKNCGAKKLGWWDRTLKGKWGEKVDFLILGHPERMKKHEYVSMVSDWLKRP